MVYFNWFMFLFLFLIFLIILYTLGCSILVRLIEDDFKLENAKSGLLVLLIITGMLVYIVSANFVESLCVMK